MLLIHYKALIKKGILKNIKMKNKSSDSIFFPYPNGSWHRPALETIVLVSLFSPSAYPAQKKAYLESMDRVEYTFFFPSSSHKSNRKGIYFSFWFFFFCPINVKFFFLIYCCIPSLVGSASLLLDTLFISFWRKVQWKNSYLAYIIECANWWKHFPQKLWWICGDVLRTPWLVRGKSTSHSS